MKPMHVNVAIIGAGTAGMQAYRSARARTDSVLLIEGGAYGTTCARVGCMPSELLIAAAQAAHRARQCEPFGVRVQRINIDGAAVMARVQRERDRFVHFALDAVDAIAPAQRLTARVRFQDAKTLVTQSGQLIHADRIVIATGSAPRVPAMLQGLGSRLLTNENLFDLPTLPASLAVFGAGPLGIELAQAMSRLGVKVKVFGVGGGVAGIQDESIRDYAIAAFNQEFYLDASSDVRSVKASETGVVIHYLHQDGTVHTESFDHILAAAGRAQNLAGLELQDTKLELDEHGIPVFDRRTMQCGDSSFFMAGDASDDAPFLHEASDQGRIAGENAARYPDVQARLRRAPLTIVFTDPQVASVGLNQKRLKADFKGSYCEGLVSFEDQGRSRTMLCNKGLLKVYAEQGSGLFLGAEMFGPAAEHIAHLLAWALQQHMTVSGMLDMPFYHPVIEEGLRTALQDISHRLQAGMPAS